MAYKTKKYELVEVVVQGTPAGQTLTRYNFPDLPKLRGTTLQAIACYPSNIIAQTSNGNTVASHSILNKSFLVLYSNDRQDLFRIPLLALNNLQAVVAGDTVSSFFLFELENQNVTWDKSYIELGSSPNNTDNFSFLFGLYYI